VYENDRRLSDDIGIGVGNKLVLQGQSGQTGITCLRHDTLSITLSVTLIITDLLLNVHGL